MDYAGAVKLFFLLLLLGGIGYGLGRVYVAGARNQKRKQLEANEAARDDAFKESEDWKSGGGLLGGIRMPDDKDSD